MNILAKRRLARALFTEATGHAPTSDWSDISEKNLDLLVQCFRGIIDGDQEVLRLILHAMCETFSKN